MASILQPSPAGSATSSSAQVEDKIETREIVQQAKELLMSQRGIDEPSAFELIQQTAMKGRVRMRDVAQQIIRGEFVG